MLANKMKAARGHTTNTKGTMIMFHVQKKIKNFVVKGFK
jgi:hypothetical protein